MFHTIKSACLEGSIGPTGKPIFYAVLEYAHYPSNLNIGDRDTTLHYSFTTRPNILVNGIA